MQKDNTEKPSYEHDGFFFLEQLYVIRNGLKYEYQF